MPRVKISKEYASQIFPQEYQIIKDKFGEETINQGLVFISWGVASETTKVSLLGRIIAPQNKPAKTKEELYKDYAERASSFLCFFKEEQMLDEDYLPNELRFVPESEVNTCLKKDYLHYEKINNPKELITTYYKKLEERGSFFPDMEPYFFN